ncbi:MAG: MFS transporter [Abditibacteriota bacterium]|nr:MFS transporter [Abditibacteriota bacterium]
MKRAEGYAGVAICFVIYTAVYLGRQNLAMAAPLLEEEGIADKAAIGLLGSIFFYVYAAGRLINGWLGDIVRPKLMLLTGFTAAALCNLAMGFLPPLWILFLLWGINGLFQSSIWGAVLNVCAGLFEDPKKREKGIIMLAPTVGLGGLLTVVLCASVSGWGAGYMFLAAGAAMLLASIPGYLFLPDARNTAPRKKTNLLSPLGDKRILRFLVPILGQGVIKDNLNLWTPIFFMQVYAIDIKQAAFYVFVMPLATLLGKLIYPFLFQYCRRNEIAAAMVCYVISALCLLPLCFWELPIMTAAALLFAVSAFIGTANASFSGMLPLRFYESGNISSVSGAVDFLTYIGSATGAAAFGFLVSRLGYGAMIWVWAALAGGSALITFLYKKEYSIPAGERQNP